MSRAPPSLRVEQKVNPTACPALLLFHRKWEEPTVTALVGDLHPIQVKPQVRFAAEHKPEVHRIIRAYRGGASEEASCEMHFVHLEFIPFLTTPLHAEVEGFWLEVCSVDGNG